MRRVGIDGHMIGDHSGGNESYYTNILLNIKKNEDIELILFLRQGVDATPFEKVYKIVRFKSKNAIVRNFIELTTLCKKYNLNVLHTQYFIPFIRPCKVACTIHDICFEHYKDIFTKKEYILQKLLIPYAAKHSDIVYTVSKHAKNDIISHYGIPQEKVVITYNAVNSNYRKMNEEEINSEELRKKFAISGSFILSVCNLQPRKNLVRLINAFLSFKR